MAPSFRRKKASAAEQSSDDAKISMSTGQTDMAAMPTASVAVDSILSNLKDRFSHHVIYTNIGPRILVAVNPWKQVPANASRNSAFDLDCVAAAATAAKAATSAGVSTKPGSLTISTGGQLPPHIFEMASGAYMHMISTGEDQVVIFSGESGSGKTESSKAFLQQLIYLNSRASEEKSHVPTEIYNSAFVLESFGNASTAFNTNSSRFNKYLELQFDVDGTIAGAKIVTFSLEIYRIAQLPAGERLFHVFNYLLAGATAEERSKLKLSDRFAYLEAGASGSRGGDKEDAEGMASLRLVMKTLGFTKKVQSSIFQTLAALLHLGNVEFDQETFHANDQAYVKNRDHLEFVAELLEVDAEALESALTNRSALVGDTMCTDFLNIAQAREARDGLVATIYSLLFTYILEHLNTRLSNNAGSNFVGLMDFAGFESGTKNGFPQLVNNYAAEKINRFVQEDLLDGPQRLLASEGLTIAHPATASQSCLELFEARPNGLIAVLDAEAQKQDRGLAAPEIAGLIAHGIGKSPFLGVSEQAKGRFSVRHYAQPVMYEASGLIQRNKTTVSADYIKLFRSLSGKNKTFLAGLFNEAKLETKKHPKNARAVVGGRRLLSTRRPTVRQPGRKSMLFEAAPRTPLSAFANSTKVSTEGLNVRTSILASSYNSLNTPLTPGTEELSKTSVFSHFRDSLDELISTFKEARCWFVVGINPNGGMQPGVFKDDKVKQQITAFELVKMAKALHEDYTVNCTFSYFLNRYWPLLFPEEDQSKDVEGPIAELKRMVGETIGKMGWTSQQAVAGKDKIFIAENLWRSLESQLDLLLPGEMRRIHRAPLTPEERDEYAHWEDQMAATGLIAGGASPIDAAGKPVLGGKALSRASLINLDVTALDEEALTGTGEAGEAKAAASPAKEEPPARKASCTRRCWTGITTFNTWWIPDYFLIKCGRMKREDVRQAWREKVSLNIMMLWMCAFLLFFVVGLGAILCPRSNVYSADEVKAHDNFDKRDLWMSWNGYVYDMSFFYHTTGSNNDLDLEATYFQFKGQDVSKYFPRYNPADGSYPAECSAGSSASRRALEKRQNTDAVNAQCSISKLVPGYCHDTTAIADKIKYQQIPIKLVGPLAFQLSQVQTHNSDSDAWMIVNDRIYDITPILNAEENMFGPATMSIFENYKGRDASVWASSLKLAMPCLEKGFFMGVVDRRNAVQCAVSVWITYGVSGLLVAIMVVRFLAALQLSSKRIPEDLDKYTICMVPCYTEGEESLRKTIDSLALLSYVDDRKLLFIVADGMIRGSGNDRPTPDIVLQILGIEASEVEHEHPALDYVAIGEGSKQHNKAKIYSGFYSIQARTIPFLVVVKCGTETETTRPGNRGKRDSQMILLNFLSRVHHREPMSPMELEIYRQIQVNIGVDPWAYEFILMVDADTVVMGDSLNRLVSCMMHDTQVMGICGETRIANEKATFITMMQVYEYYISHHLAKAFESLFGNVTCLPGCFSMYRIRTPGKAKPLIIAPELLAEYSINRVDTLHKKNLLSLGEDRYLTTLMLKHFPDFRTKFTPDAHCETVVPDKVEVLLSQRRRWINSTIHNQYELLLVNQLCGFLCFSMRFVVALDLFATFTMPAACAYLVYLIVASIQSQTAPTISLILMAAAYGLQMIIFMLKRKFEHIGWMIISFLAFPFFWFYLPLYSFWHFDDFSWGNTRRVAGSNGKDTHVADADFFDPSIIPAVTWEKYVQDVTSQHETEKATKSAGLEPGEYIQASAKLEHSTSLSMDQNSRLSYAAPTTLSVPGYAPSDVSGAAPSSLAASAMASSIVAPSISYAPSGTAPVGYAAPYPPDMVMLNHQSLIPGLPTMVGMPGMPMMADPMDMRALAAAMPVVHEDTIEGMPSDEEIVYQIRVLLSTHDLQTLTKKKVREELAAIFGVDMTPKKQFIGEIVEGIINGEI